MVRTLEAHANAFTWKLPHRSALRKLRFDDQAETSRNTRVILVIVVGMIRFVGRQAILRESVQCTFVTKAFGPFLHPIQRWPTVGEMWQKRWNTYASWLMQ